MFSGREAYGAYTKFATEMANLAITVAKSFYLLAIPTFGSECDRPVARATRRAKRRQYRRRHRCNNLHNPLQSFFLRHTLLILMVLAQVSVSLRR